MPDKYDKPTSRFQKSSDRSAETPDPQLADAAAKGDPMAAALAEEVAKEERHPATKAVMARRADPRTVPDEVVRTLLAVGDHRASCPTKTMSHHACSCGWGPAAAEAEEVLGIRAEKAAKAAEDMKTHAVQAVPTP